MPILRLLSLPVRAPLLTVLFLVAVVLGNHWHGRTEQLVCDIQGRSKDRNFKMPSLWLNPEHKR